MTGLSLVRAALRASSLCFLLCLTLPSSAQTLTILASFNGTNGRSPNALMQGKDGNLYGTTSYGGAGPCTVGGVAGCGTVFKLTTGGTFTSLHAFVLTDGALPGGGLSSTLTQGSDGNIYGVAEQGGPGTGCSGLSNACGLVFKIAPSGAVSTVYNFMGSPDGGNPINAPIMASDGNLYGTTFDPGTVYMMTAAGSEMPILQVSSAADPQGSVPVGGLAQVSAGIFFGTTLAGGANDRGTVYSITPSGNRTVLYSFTNGADGGQPRFSLVPASDGNVYGTTTVGGIVNSPCPLGCGTIFKITPAGVFSTVHVFTGAADGAGAEQLVKGADGNIYGITFVGSTSALFKLTSAGALTNLYTFNPTLPAGLITQGGDGTFYGVVGGTGTAYPNGAIFSLTLGSSTTGPIITPGGIVSTSAYGEFSSVAPGEWVDIYGTNLSTTTRGWAASDFSGNNAPTSLDGVSVSIAGQPAFVEYISSGQINVLLPSTVPTGPQQLTVTSGGITSAASTITVNALEPGLLAPPSFNLGGVQYAVGIFTDGTYALPPGAIAGVTSRPAKPGDTLTLYGVGFGPVTPSVPAGVLVQELTSIASDFHISIGGVAAGVPFAGLAPTFTGLYQLNVTVPSVSPGNQPLAFTLGGSAGAQTLFLPVGN
jgi:uncharacterized protein (TIGR03437 family)